MGYVSHRTVVDRLYSIKRILALFLFSLSPPEEAGSGYQNIGCKRTNGTLLLNAEILAQPLFGVVQI
jgi:hypothetical protein